MLVSEVMNLPDHQRHEIRQLQHDYVAEWVRLICLDRPELGEPTARFTVHAILTIINDIARTRQLHRRPNITAELHSAARLLERTIERSGMCDAGAPRKPASPPMLTPRKG